MITITAACRNVAALLLAALLIMTDGAHAATMLSKEEANAYYAKCMETPDRRLSDQTKMEFCACTSAQMMQTMSAEDIQVMNQDSAAGRIMLNKMMIAVYGPCLSGPITELTAGQCEADPRIALASQTQDPNAICACVDSSTREWLDTEGPDIMNVVIAENAFITEPLAPVIESGAYRRHSYEIMMSCMQSRETFKQQHRAP